MSTRLVALLSLLAVTQAAFAADWVLATKAGSVLMYDAETMNEYSLQGTTIRGGQSGRFLPTATMQNDKLVPYAPGMQVGGELREGQLLLAPDGVAGAWVEFAIKDATRLSLAYGQCDEGKAKNAGGMGLDFTLLQNGKIISEKRVELSETRWQEAVLPVPKGEVLVRIFVNGLKPASWNWTGLVLTGDGEILSKERAVALCPNREQLNKTDLTLKPTDKRVSARAGYDTLFYDGQPYPNYCAKGHRSGTHRLQKDAGINLFYNEGSAFTSMWNEADEAAGVVVPPDGSMYRDLVLNQQVGFPYKTAMSLAHCVPFMPPWMVTKYNLGLEDHKIRNGGPTHASFIKAKTQELYKRGLEGWVKPFIGQPSIFVFGQEDEISLWDDQGAEAQGLWREWLKKRFGNSYAGFSAYVGGVQGATSFEQAPYPKHLGDHPAYGYPKRASYLKLLWQTEAYADFLGQVCKHVHKLAPEVPLTQRYVADPFGRAISNLTKFDYNYCYGHLSSEGVEGGYGSGKKIWTGIYGHFGVLPFPRGGSIGFTVNREIRRGQMDEKLWALNAYTLLANGACGFEGQPLLTSWGPAWEGGALFDAQLKPTTNGLASQKVMKAALALAPYMEHYDRFEDVAIYQDEPYQSRTFGAGLNQSKVGAYTLIREMGYQPEPLTTWDMTPEKLATKKVLILAGSVPLAPEVQEAIRQYVRQGGLLISFYSAQGAGFPGSNGYEFKGEMADCAAECAFEAPRAQSHLGDVLGIVSGGGAARRAGVKVENVPVSLAAFNALVDEKRWVEKEASCAKLQPVTQAETLATFDDGSPAVITHEFGKGRAITYAFDLGLIANNVTMPELYQPLDNLLAGRGCRKVYDTGSYFVESGMWHNDRGQKLLILINHDQQQAHPVKLPDGTSVTIQPGEVHVWKSA
jgi:hypothetical protein